MEYFILDTNIISSNPKGMARIRKDVQYCITNATKNELETNIHNIQYKSVINELIKYHNIEIIGNSDKINDINLPRVKIREEYDENILKDLNDLKNKQNYIFVSNDKDLKIKVKNINIRVFSKIEFVKYINEKEIVDKNIINNISDKNNQYISSVIKFILITISLFSMSILVAKYLFNNELNIDNEICKIIWFLIVIILAVLLFRLRKYKSVYYGLIEIVFSIIIIFSGIMLENILDVIKILGGLYIFIRGCDNIEKGKKIIPYGINNILEKILGK